MSQQINLYNPVFLRKKHYFSAVTMVQAMVAVLAGAIGVYALELRQNHTLESVLAESEQRVATQREQLVRFSKEFSEQGASRALTDDLARSEERLRQRQLLLGELTTGVGGDAEGFSRFLGALARQSTPGVWITGVEIGTRKETDVVIRGRALESNLVPVYIRSLNREAPFAGRSVGELRLAAKGSAARMAPAPGAAPLASTDPQEPARYIEFHLSIPLNEAPTPVAPAKGGS